MNTPLTAAGLQRIRNRAGLLSLMVGVVMLGLKMGAYLITGSATILSDALESVVHIAATAVMFWCLQVAARMPDEDHPYGHGKAEFLSVGFEGGSILLAALGIVWEAGRSLITGHAPAELGTGFLMVALAVVINVILGLHLIRVGRRTGSSILVADGQHVLSDVWTSAGVLLGVIMLALVPDPRQRSWCDAIVAVVLAGILVFAGIKLMRQALSGLLDEADLGQIAKVVAAVNEIRDPEWYDLHNLRLRTSGDLVFVEFHLAVPSDWTIARGHDVMDALEIHILERLGAKGSVMIHLDHRDLAAVRARLEAMPDSANQPFSVDTAIVFHGDGMPA